MFFLAFFGFLVLLALGCCFTIAGLSILVWGWAHKNFEWTGVLPTLFGLLVIRASFVVAPFTITMGLTT